MKRGRKPRRKLGMDMKDPFQLEIDRCIGQEPECILRVLDAASHAARETADHLRSNWQERRMARSWDKIARVVESAHSKVKRELPF